MKNILVPTDFSAESHHAYGVALQLARRTGGQVTLLHVLDELGDNSANFSTYGGPVNGSDLPNSEGVPDGLFAVKLLEVTKQRMQALVAEAAGVPVHDAVASGEVEAAILNAIRQHGIDLVVVGAQQHDTLESWFNASVTEGLVRDAPCPVLAVKHEHAQFEARSIVYPTDCTPRADEAVPELKHLLSFFPDATLHLLHIGDESDQADEQLAEFAQRHQLPNAQVTVVDASSPASGIGHFAKRVQADLIVLPAHARSGLSRLFGSSVAEDVATHAFPPVLTFHPHAVS